MADPGKLHPLSELDETVADPREDIRGADVIDKSGNEAGTVQDLLVDAEENKVRFARVASGGFLGMGQDHYLVPVDAITDIEDNTVHIDREREGMEGVPTYDPHLAYDRDYYGGVYGYWGYSPY